MIKSKCLTNICAVLLVLLVFAGGLWAQTADVPDEYAWSMAMLVSERRAVKYQIPDSRYQRIKLEGREAIVRIRELQAPAKMGQTEIENF